MARIVYGVAGEGFGHSSRSLLIGKYLLDQGHDVLFVGSMKSLKVLSQYFPGRVKEAFGMWLVYKNNRLKMVPTFVTNVWYGVPGLVRNSKLFNGEIAEFGPDLVISDFEPFLAWWARNNRIPCLTIDHQCTLTHLKLDRIKGTFFPRLMAEIITHSYYLGINHHIIVNFFQADVVSKESILAPPVIRLQVEQLKPQKGSHITCYMTDESLREKWVNMFTNFRNIDFYIYGLNEESQFGNCFFKKTSTENFLEDLSCCRAAIATAGFSVISECLHFDKKMLLMPMLQHYEQLLNTYYAEKLGLGMHWKGFNEEGLHKFIDSIDTVPVKEELVLRPDNLKFFSILDCKIKEMIK